MSVRRLLTSSSSTLTRFYHHSSKMMHGGAPAGPETLHVRWIMKDGSEKVTPAAVGDSLLHVAHRYGIELEGACEGVCACSTCHVILSKPVYDALPEASEIEEDMLDQAFGLTATSRLGCQVKLEEGHDHIVIKLPKATRNFYVVSFSNLSFCQIMFNVVILRFVK